MYKTNFTFELSTGKKLSIYCWRACGGSVGFQHRCNVIINNEWIDKFYKVQYYNRTWEYFQFESLLNHTARMLKNEKHITDDEMQELFEMIKNKRF